MGEREIDYLIKKNLEKMINKVREPNWTLSEREVLYGQVFERIGVNN